MTIEIAPESRRPDPDALPRGQRERRDRIVAAALDLLEHGEYESIQVRDVAEHAGVALATLYRYFSSKDHLYAAVLLEWSTSFRPRAAPDDVRPGEDAEQLSAMLARVVRAFERRPQMLRAEIALESSSDDNARAIFYRFGFQNMNAMSSALPNLSQDRAAAVIETTNCVLAMQLRYWALGRCSIEYVYQAVQRSVDLIFPPET